MSDAHDFPVHSEDDAVPGRPIGIVTLVTCLVGAACVGIAWLLLTLTEAGSRPSGQFYERDLEQPTVVENVETTLIETGAPGADLAARHRAVLDSYGWVSQDEGIVRIPIERAMQLVQGGTE